MIVLEQCYIELRGSKQFYIIHRSLAMMKNRVEVHVKMDSGSYLEHHLDRVYGNDRRIRKDISRYLVELATIGACYIDKYEMESNERVKK